jgi:septum formation topological specificity factor MinE
VQLRHALVAVESAIVLREERAPEDAEPANLEGLRQDLLVALWLTEVLLSKH